ncbi:MAG: PQQ-dependent sugar dehydrogenase [Pseudomonadota bacterium]
MHRLTRLKTIAATLALCLHAAGAAANDHVVETVTDGLDYPWSVAFLPDGGFLVTENSGQLRRIGADGTPGPALAGVPDVYFAGQGGLFDVVLDPGFADNRRLYLSYAEGGPAANRTAVLRAELGADSLDNAEVIFRLRPDKDTPVHYGGRLAFDADGFLLLTSGDGFDYREAAQSPDAGLGKLLRFDTDGRPPPAPVFPEAPYVVSYGHRNPQGLVVAGDGTVYLHEHGPRGGDEVNRIVAGGNYGWPAVTHGLDYNGAYVSPYTTWPGMEDPLVVWTPSIAPSGLALYDGDAFPGWSGSLFAGALVERSVRRLVLDGDRLVSDEILFAELGERIRDVRQGPDGLLYLLTDGAGGKLLRVRPRQPPGNDD